MRMRALPCLLLPGLVLLGACTDFDSAQEVKDLRVLGVRIDPPEVFVTVPAFQAASRQVFLWTVAEDPPPVTVEVLAVNPLAPEAPVNLRVSACIPPDRRRCEVAEGTVVHVIEGLTTRLDDVSFTFAPTAAQLNQWVQEDPYFGFGGLYVLLDIEIEQPDSPVLHVAKLMTYDVPYLPETDEEPPEKTPNDNPLLYGLRVDDRESLTEDEVIPVRARQEVALEPLFVREAVIESYLEPTFPKDGELGWIQLEERLQFDYYATAGDFDDGTISTRTPLGEVKDITNTWTAPREPGDVELWIVVRDDRGGTTWTRRVFRVGAAP